MLITLSPLFPMAVSGIAVKQTAGTQSHAVCGVSSHLEVCVLEVWAGVRGVVVWDWWFDLSVFQNYTF